MDSNVGQNGLEDIAKAHEKGLKAIADAIREGLLAIANSQGVAKMTYTGRTDDVMRQDRR